jgi:Domain of unknown function (DUF6504)
VSVHASSPKRFVSEPIAPVGGVFDAAAMATGEPGLPSCFRWRGVEYEVARVLERWKTTGDCRHGSGERYVRRHWYRVEVTDGTVMEIYFDRQPRSGRSRERWWVATIVEQPTV